MQRTAMDTLEADLNAETVDTVVPPVGNHLSATVSRDGESNVIDGVRRVLAKQSLAVSAQHIWCAMLDVNSLQASQGSDVRSAEIVSSLAPDRRIVDWKIWLKGFELQWREEQMVDAPNQRIEFGQVQGMFATYRGSWQVTGVGDLAFVEIRIYVDIGLPYLAGFLNPVIEKAYEQFAHGLIRAWADKPRVT